MRPSFSALYVPSFVTIVLGLLRRELALELELAAAELGLGALGRRARPVHRRVLAPLGLADAALGQLPRLVPLGALELVELDAEVAARLAGEEEAVGRDLELLVALHVIVRRDVRSSRTGFLRILRAGRRVIFSSSVTTVSAPLLRVSTDLTVITTCLAGSGDDALDRIVGAAAARRRSCTSTSCPRPAAGSSRRTRAASCPRSGSRRALLRDRRRRGQGRARTVAISAKRMRSVSYPAPGPS